MEASSSGLPTELEQAAAGAADADAPTGCAPPPLTSALRELRRATTAEPEELCAGALDEAEEVCKGRGEGDGGGKCERVATGARGARRRLPAPPPTHQRRPDVVGGAVAERGAGAAHGAATPRARCGGAHALHVVELASGGGVCGGRERAVGMWALHMQ